LFGGDNDDGPYCRPAAVDDDMYRSIAASLAASLATPLVSSSSISVDPSSPCVSDAVSDVFAVKVAVETSAANMQGPVILSTPTSKSVMVVSELGLQINESLPGPPVSVLIPAPQDNWSFPSSP
jgi:hypothetical protein